MDFTTDRWRQVRPWLSDPRLHVSAPMVVSGGLMTLAGDEDAVASLAQVQLEDDSTTWKVAWVTPTRLIYAEATAEMADWLLDAEAQAPIPSDAATYWARPLSEVVRLELTDVAVVTERVVTSRDWRSGVRVHFADGAEVSVPLVPGSQEYRTREQVERVVMTLVKATSRRA